MAIRALTWTVARRIGLMIVAALALAACAGVQLSSQTQAREPSYSEPPLVTQSGLKLWYDEPGASWEHHGLPIGNGAMGAVILGGVASDRIQFNEKTLWTGGPGAVGGYSDGRPQGSSAQALAEVRRQLARDGRMDPEAVADRLGQSLTGFGAYQTFGELVLDFPASNSTASAYRRELDIAHAVAEVAYEQDDVRFVRDYFASYPDGVIAFRIVGDQPGRVNFTASLAVPDNRTVEARVQDGRVVASGALHDNRLQWEAQFQVIAEGGAREDLNDGRVRIVDADAAWIVLGAATNYAQDTPTMRGVAPHEALTRRIDSAVVKGYDRLRADHIADFTALFDRVALDIGQTPSDMPTDEARLAYVGAGSPQDRALEALYFQYGRYLLISSSRAGSLPANLQGVWNNSTSPPWESDYHVNINLQMNYWPAEQTNLSETAEPLFDFVEFLAPSGQVSAQRIVGARGWTMFLTTNIWGFTGVQNWATAFWQPEAGAWLAQHLYEHYRFTRDETFLRARAYPVMKEAAQFWLDTLVADSSSGQLLVSPSYSPEHGPFSAGASMSQQIVFDLFANVSEAAALHGDAQFAAEIDAARARLDPGLRIGSWGQLQEWREDWDDRTNTHRHVSHLFALHPGRQVSPMTTPEFAEAARVSLRARGDGGTGWSKAWKVNFWARLLDGDHAHLMLAEQLKESTLPNLWDTHPPFQIDGNFGATAGVAEMLLQSQNNEIHVLPALPGAWPSGAVRGLRARGDVVVDVQWQEGRAREIVLTTGHAGSITLRSSVFAEPFSVVNTHLGELVETTGEGEVRTFQAQAGARYLVNAIPRGAANTRRVE